MQSGKYQPLLAMQFDAAFTELLHANLARSWLSAHESSAASIAVGASRTSTVLEFTPLQCTAAAPGHSTQEIVIELRRGPATETVRWPITASGKCATLAAELVASIRIDRIWLPTEPMYKRVPAVQGWLFSNLYPSDRRMLTVLHLVQHIRSMGTTIIIVLIKHRFNSVI